MSGATVAAPPERFPPSLTGLVAQTCDIAEAQSSFQPTTNDAIGILCPIPTPVSVSRVWVNIATAGITLTAGQNLISLHDANGNILATSPDQSAAWLNPGAQSALFPGAPIRLASPYCWLQLLAVGTTIPFFSSAGLAPAVNLGPATILRSQRVASGAISLASFNPATSVTQRNLIEIGLS